MHNLSTLERKLFFTYETFVRKTEDCLERIAEFLPELDDLHTDFEFASHNVMGWPLHGVHDLNHEKIGNMRMMGAIGPANTVLSQHRNLLEYFGYGLLGS